MQTPDDNPGHRPDTDRRRPPGRPRRLAIAAALAGGALSISGCGGGPPAPHWSVAGGDAQRGAELTARSNCGVCHEIAGLPDARGVVGPSLKQFARRTTIAGVMANKPANLVLWVQHPQAVIPRNAMPDIGLTTPQARDIAAYLYTLD